MSFVENKDQKARINKFKARVTVKGLYCPETKQSRVLHVGHFKTKEEQRKAEQIVKEEANKFIEENPDCNKEEVFKEQIKKVIAQLIPTKRSRGRRTITGKTQRHKIREIQYNHKDELENYKPPVEAYVSGTVRAGRKIIGVGKFSSREVLKEAKRMLINKAEKEIDEKYKSPTDENVAEIYSRLTKELFPRKSSIKQ